MTRVAAALIHKEGRILVGQRRKDSRYGLKWEFPGGKIEAGESVLDCLRRELREELAIEIGAYDRSVTQTHQYADGGQFEVNFCFVSRFVGEPANLAFEQLRWVTLAELKSLDILEGNVQIVSRLDESMFTINPNQTRQ